MRVSSFIEIESTDFEKQFPLYQYELSDILDLLKVAIKVTKGKPDVLTIKALVAAAKTEPKKYVNLIDELEIKSSKLRQFLK